MLFLRPRSHGTGRIWDRTNQGWKKYRTMGPFGPMKISSRFLRDWFQILTNPCEHRNWSFSRLICMVDNSNEPDNAMKLGLSNKQTRSIDVLKTTTKM